MLYMILFLLCAGASSIGALVDAGGVAETLIGSKISKKIPDRRVEMPCLCLYLA